MNRIFLIYGDFTTQPLKSLLFHIPIRPLPVFIIYLFHVIWLIWSDKQMLVPLPSLTMPGHYLYTPRG